MTEVENQLISPALILVFSGKRKSGKDYITDKILSEVGKEVCAIMKLSEPIKRQYALDHDLDFEKLLDSSEYKEIYRSDMIIWGENRRDLDPGYFCRISTLQSPNRDKPVWIISDARRLTDVEYFRTTYPEQTFTVRVIASEATRQSRGWQFTEGIDDAPSECGLDTGVDFDLIICNDGDERTVGQGVERIVTMIKEELARQTEVS